MKYGSRRTKFTPSSKKAKRLSKLLGSEVKDKVLRTSKKSTTVLTAEDLTKSPAKYAKACEKILALTKQIEDMHDNSIISRLSTALRESKQELQRLQQDQRLEQKTRQVSTLRKKLYRNNEKENKLLQSLHTLKSEQHKMDDDSDDDNDEEQEDSENEDSVASNDESNDESSEEFSDEEFAEDSDEEENEVSNEEDNAETDENESDEEELQDEEIEEKSIKGELSDEDSDLEISVQAISATSSASDYVAISMKLEKNKSGKCSPKIKVENSHPPQSNIQQEKTRRGPIFNLKTTKRTQTVGDLPVNLRVFEPMDNCDPRDWSGQEGDGFYDTIRPWGETGDFAQAFKVFIGGLIQEGVVAETKLAKLIAMLGHFHGEPEPSWLNETNMRKLAADISRAWAVLDAARIGEKLQSNIASAPSESSRTLTLSSDASSHNGEKILAMQFDSTSHDEDSNKTKEQINLGVREVPSGCAEEVKKAVIDEVNTCVKFSEALKQTSLTQMERRVRDGKVITKETRVRIAPKQELKELKQYLQQNTTTPEAKKLLSTIHGAKSDAANGAVLSSSLVLSAAQTFSDELGVSKEQRSIMKCMAHLNGGCTDRFSKELPSIPEIDRDSENEQGETELPLLAVTVGKNNKQEKLGSVMSNVNSLLKSLGNKSYAFGQAKDSTDTRSSVVDKAARKLPREVGSRSTHQCSGASTIIAFKEQLVESYRQIDKMKEDGLNQLAKTCQRILTNDDAIGRIFALERWHDVWLRPFLNEYHQKDEKGEKKYTQTDAPMIVAELMTVCDASGWSIIDGIRRPNKDDLTKKQVKERIIGCRNVLEFCSVSDAANVIQVLSLKYKHALAIIRESDQMEKQGIFSYRKEDTSKMQKFMDEHQAWLDDSKTRLQKSLDEKKSNSNSLVENKQCTFISHRIFLSNFSHYLLVHQPLSQFIAKSPKNPEVSDETQTVAAFYESFKLNLLASNIETAFGKVKETVISRMPDYIAPHGEMYKLVQRNKSQPSHLQEKAYKAANQTDLDTDHVERTFGQDSAIRKVAPSMTTSRISAKISSKQNKLYQNIVALPQAQSNVLMATATAMAKYLTEKRKEDKLNVSRQRRGEIQKKAEKRTQKNKKRDQKLAKLDGKYPVTTIEAWEAVLAVPGRAKGVKVDEQFQLIKQRDGLVKLAKERNVDLRVTGKSVCEKEAVLREFIGHMVVALRVNPTIPVIPPDPNADINVLVGINTSSVAAGSADPNPGKKYKSILPNGKATIASLHLRNDPVVSAPRKRSVESISIRATSLMLEPAARSEVADADVEMSKAAISPTKQRVPNETIVSGRYSFLKRARKANPLYEEI